MTEPGVRIERSDNALVAVLDRPERRNAIARTTARALAAFAEKASSDSEIRGAIVTAQGDKMFAAGGDLLDFAPLVDSPEGASEVLAMGQTMVAFEECEVPVIAAVQGNAYGGGCELLLACDLVILEEHVTLSFRQVAMGLSTGWGGGTRLVARVGARRAAEVLLVRDSIAAEDALRMGLANQVVARGRSLSAAKATVAQLSRHPRGAVAGVKRMLIGVQKEARGQGLQREAEVFAQLWGTPDHRKAVESFLSGRAGNQ